MSIKSFFSYDILAQLVKVYKKIPALYKTTFWTVFIVLNIVFAYHTANFIWGNHEWEHMRTGLNWKTFWYEEVYLGYNDPWQIYFSKTFKYPLNLT